MVPVVRYLALGVVVAVPVGLLVVGVQLALTEGYMALEYGRSDFPPDGYGFTFEERLAYAVETVGCLRAGGWSSACLMAMSFSGGVALYNARELRHLEDVVLALRGVFGVGVVLFVFSVVCVVVFVFGDMTTRIVLLKAISQGGILMLSVLAVLLGLAVLRWDQFFEGFHHLFFADGTWRFEYSDTLIRLFPEKFWFDTALNLGLFTAAGAIALIAISSWALRRISRQHPDGQDAAG
ncbi:MAG: DUF1461 domain-containing protein [Anaerolineae bacterium]|nr:DUF1461 domain-containing protein [Anaerolineae bacterium]